MGTEDEPAGHRRSILGEKATCYSCEQEQKGM